MYDETVSPYLPLSTKANTRGNNYKLLNHSFHCNLRKHYFSARIVNPIQSNPFYFRHLAHKKNSTKKHRNTEKHSHKNLGLEQST